MGYVKIVGSQITGDLEFPIIWTFDNLKTYKYKISNNGQNK